MGKLFKKGSAIMDSAPSASLQLNQMVQKSPVLTATPISSATLKGFMKIGGTAMRDWV